MPTRKPAVLLAMLVAGAGILSAGVTGCTAVVPPSDNATHLSEGGWHSCARGSSVQLDGQSRSFVISGSCGVVTVHGNGITVRLQRAASLEVDGQSASITVEERIGSALIKGNGISLTADSIGSVQITGQSNSIIVPALGSVMVQGDHNAVKTHLKPSDYRVIGQDDTLTVE
ncbi:hypothetical protein GCM10028798_27460 [Humibacter antri]